MKSSKRKYSTMSETSGIDDYSSGTNNSDVTPGPQPLKHRRLSSHSQGLANFLYPSKYTKTAKSGRPVMINHITNATATATVVTIATTTTTATTTTSTGYRNHAPVFEKVLKMIGAGEGTGRGGAPPRG
eukprot:TRINITY_DN8430_c0_g1_i2.p1 TRINITY_DN8430_c0_g1~~TRINITY_DN8430_c0_g1_i2.p1  ORF type:complete len:129 (+),score=29.86 TRINITY_DN8430_c0_g1_i2:147-533(+)